MSVYLPDSNRPHLSPANWMIRRLVERYAPVMCVLILIGFAFAGLWPFHTLKNDADWLGSENGIRLLGFGIVQSDGLLPYDGSAGTGCSIELWLQHLSNTGNSTILDVYDPDHRGQFRILQIGNSELSLISSDARTMGLEYPFQRDKRTLVTVTSDDNGTTVYMDAEAAKASENVTVSARDCSGRLVLGSAANFYANWNGDLLGVAIYRQKLTPSQVLRHYNGWSTNKKWIADPAEKVAARYKFDERTGITIHNEIPGAPNLYIPPSFQIPYHSFLEPPWKEFESEGIGWKDVFINIAGFIPFGFFLFSILHSSRFRKFAGVLSVIVGALISLMIELLQWYLPTRDSSMTDLITNVLGTSLGALGCFILFEISSRSRTLRENGK